ncbi:hypothetical protein EVAR_42845_1 [Eumeta japonica]|uniref:Uncharacterized protein n=1 Tax=Eumeta variegata TaxID=151549 RepID=A0A4C1WJ58_EUMVA|nr:hypothetical protein EVAR_42845_1 [Eumeta japonica]
MLNIRNENDVLNFRILHQLPDFQVQSKVLRSGVPAAACATAGGTAGYCASYDGLLGTRDPGMPDRITSIFYQLETSTTLSPSLVAAILQWQICKLLNRTTFRSVRVIDRIAPNEHLKDGAQAARKMVRSIFLRSEAERRESAGSRQRRQLSPRARRRSANICIQMFVLINLLKKSSSGDVRRPPSVLLDLFKDIRSTLASE